MECGRGVREKRRKIICRLYEIGLVMRKGERVFCALWQCQLNISYLGELYSKLLKASFRQSRGLFSFVSFRFFIFFIFGIVFLLFFFFFLSSALFYYLFIYGLASFYFLCFYIFNLQ